MPVTKFPDPKLADPDGILALGGDLHPQTLILAYRQGIFPWPMENYPLVWFSPQERAILEFSRLHIPRSLAKTLKKAPYSLTLNKDFQGVIQKCAQIPRAGQNGTWITPEMIEAYIHLHHLGFAVSAEAWENDTLVGGIYGVFVDGLFAGESMFHLRPNASKIALLHLIDWLRSQGTEWIDIQMMTPHMEALGAHCLPRDEFLKKVAQTRSHFKRSTTKRSKRL